MPCGEYLGIFGRISVETSFTKFTFRIDYNISFNSKIYLFEMSMECFPSQFYPIYMYIQYLVAMETPILDDFDIVIETICLISCSPFLSYVHRILYRVSF